MIRFQSCFPGKVYYKYSDMLIFNAKRSRRLNSIGEQSAYNFWMKHIIRLLVTSYTRVKSPLSISSLVRLSNLSLTRLFSGFDETCHLWICCLGQQRNCERKKSVKFNMAIIPIAFTILAEICAFLLDWACDSTVGLNVSPGA